MIPWSDDQWRERRDNDWTAGCRWLQSWWREVGLDLEPGPRRPSDPERLVASMLPLGVDDHSNFLSPESADVAAQLMSRVGGSGIVEADRLIRNLLSSQPACVNLFGPFVSDPSGLTAWVQSLDPECVDVTDVTIEWAPPRSEHFDGGSAFDAFIEYATPSGLRFVGVETKYAEDLRSSRISVRDVYLEFTRESNEWLEGAERRLDTPLLRQFWLNTLLVQSLVQRGGRYERGTGVVVACAEDHSAGIATHRVRNELHDPDSWIRWVPYAEVLATLDPSLGWTADFRRRYLDFAPVAHLLSEDDPRLVELAAGTEGLFNVCAMGARVLGEGSVIEQITAASSEGRLRHVNSMELAALDARATALAVDLRTLRESAYPIWSQIEGVDS